LLQESSVPDNVSPKEESIEALRRRVALAGKFGWIVVSGLTAIACRERGEKALNDIWSALLSSEQRSRFPGGSGEARHRQGSAGGGGGEISLFQQLDRWAFASLCRGDAEEGVDQVPLALGHLSGDSGIAGPPSVRRTILGTWHPRNGELLGCPRLGWVATKFVSEGHPYDEGYFCEYDHNLAPDQRMRIQPTERSPEFDPAKAPKLDPPSGRNPAS